MKVFLSWSGDTSKALTEVMRQWLPAVIQAVRPYFSPDDVAKGSRWSPEIAGELADSRIGLIFVTNDNLGAPWVMFEAGALSKNVGTARVVPLLFGLEPTDLTGPLVQFQAAKFDRAEMKRVVHMINTELGDLKLGSDVLDSVFDMWWPKLQEQVERILQGTKVSPKGKVRSERDLLVELLSLVRSQSRGGAKLHVHPDAIKDLSEGFTMLLQDLNLAELPDSAVDAVIALGKPVLYLASRPELASAHGGPPDCLPTLNARFAEFKTLRSGREVDNLPL